jgi:hypothetical protein
MKASVKKVVGASALGALSVVELLHLQQASATPVTYTGNLTSYAYGTLQVQITVDGASGTYRITGITTPVQPADRTSTSINARAIPILVSTALASQSASINGVSGVSATFTMPAWESSLASAIAKAAAAGQTVGQPSVVVAPTPTTTSPSSSTGGTPAPAATDSTGALTPQIIVPTGIPTSVATFIPYAPFYLPPFVGAAPANLAPYFSAVSAAISRIASSGGEGRSAAIAAAQSALSQLQSAVNASQGSSDAINAYIANANAGMQYFVNKGNQDISDYYVKVAKAANQLYLDAQASAAAIKAEPAPTVTVTVTATATVTATPKPTPSSVIIKPGGVIKKTFSCIKTLNGVTTTQVVKAFIVKCPVGFTLKK